MKTFRSLSLSLAVALTSVFALTTCKDVIGLGGAVDINPPIIQSETVYPPINAVVRDSFLLSVVVDDDRKVQAVSALLTCMEGGANYSHQFFLEQKGNRWQTFIDRSKDHPKYRPVDGQYMLKITAKDASGKEVELESRLVIDNTPPLLVLQRPSTAVIGTPSAGDADIFGDAFFLAGQVYDSCPVESLQLTAQPVGGSDAKTITLKNIPQTIRMTVDSFSAQDPGFYKTIYGNNHAGNKTFSYSMKVADSARLYQDSQNIEGSGEGNSTETYYLYEDVYQDVLSKHKIDTVYNMTRKVSHPDGRSVGSGETPETVTQVLERLAQAAIKKDGARKGAFTLNPSINPKYGIEGHSPKRIPENGVLTGVFDDIYEDSPINVKLSPNFDEDPLHEADHYEFYVIDLERYHGAYNTYDIDVNNDDQLYLDTTAQTLKTGIIKIQNAQIIKKSKSGSSHIMTIALPRLEYQPHYILQVRGSDQKHTSHTMVADPKDSGGYYGFKVKKNAKLPEVQVKKINNRDAQNGRFYVKKGDAVLFSVEVKDSAKGKVSYTLSTAPAGSFSDVPYTSSGTIAIPLTIPKEIFSQTKSQSYTLTVKAHDDEGKGTSLPSECQIYYDVEGPVITANAPTLVTEMPVIAGDIYDAGCGVDFASIKAAYKYESEPLLNLPFAESATADNKNWRLESIPNPKEGKYEIVLNAKDTLGQAGTETKINFIYDTENPRLESVNATSIDLLRKGKKLETTSDTLTLTGRIVEKNKIKSLKIGKKGGTPETVPVALAHGSTDTYSFTQTFTALPEGDCSFIITVEDAAGKTDTAEITAVVDTKAPQFKKMKLGVHEFDSASDPNPFTGTTAQATTRTPTVPISGEFEDAGQGVKALIVEWQENTEHKREVFTAVPVEGTDNRYKAEGAITLLHARTEIICKIQDGSGKETSWNTILIRSNEQLDVHIELAAPASPYTQDDTPYVKEAFTLRLTGTFNGDDAQNLDLRINKDGTAISPADLDGLNLAITKKEESGYNPFTAIQKDGNKITGFKSGNKVKPSEEYLITFTPRPQHKDDGRYVFIFRSAAGDVQKQRIVWIDTKAPELTPRVPADGQSLKDPPKLFAVASDVPGVGIKEVKAVLLKNGSSEPVSLNPIKGSSVESAAALNLQEGENSIRFEYKDHLNNSDAETITFHYDKTPPVVSAVQVNGGNGDTVLIGTQPNGDMESFNVAGTVQDTIGMKNVRAAVTSKKTGNEIGLYPKKVITGKTAQPFSWTIEHGILKGLSTDETVDGEYTIAITAEDEAGLTSTVVKTFIVDRDKPEVAFDTPTANSTVNKTITVSGTASDKRKLKSVTVKQKDGASDRDLTGVTVSAEATGGSANTAIFTGDKAAAWSFQLDTTQYAPVTTGSTGKKSIILKVIAEDEVGNKTEQECPINIDQHTDRPVITINSFAHIAPADANLVGTRTLTGRVEDDDGAVDLSKMTIQIGANVPAPVEFANGVWKYAIPTGIADGTYDLHFTVTDKKGTPFTTLATITDPPSTASSTAPAPRSTTDFDRPAVLGYDDAAGNALGKDIKFRLDTEHPEFAPNGVRFVTGAAYSDSGSVPVQTNTILGNKANQRVSFKVLVKDASGFKKVSLKLGASSKDGTPSGTPDPSGYTAYLFQDVVLSEGAMPLVITAVDNVGFETVWQETTVSDFTKPEIVIQNPQGTVNKTITVSGTASDRQTLKSLKIVQKGSGTDIPLRGVSNSNGIAADKAEFDTNTAAVWSFKLDTTQYVSAATGTGTGSIVLKAIAEDESGNVTETEHTVTINQHEDRPHIIINSFAAIAPDKANLVGTRVLAGKVEDDDGIVVSPIKISIGTMSADVPVTSNGSWKYTIPNTQADAAYPLNFTLTDKQGTVFKTDTSVSDFARPFVLGYDDAASDARSENITFRLDTVQPEFREGGITFVLEPSYAESGSSPIGANTILGNKDKRIASFKVLVKDASGIKKVVMQLGNNSGITGVHTSSFDTDGFEAWLFNNVTLTQGEKPLIITATDKADFDKIWKETVIVDFEPPAAEVRAAILDAVYFLNADIVGTVTDNKSNGTPNSAGISGVSGVQEGSLEYKIGNSGWLPEKHTVSGVDLSTLKQNPGTWEITIPDVTKYKDGFGATPPATGSTSKIYTIPVQVRMKDRAGNQGISQEYIVQFDPAGSTPIVELITPDTDAVLGTSVVVTGLARTAKPGVTAFVNKIEMQLRQENTAFGDSWVLDGKNFGTGEAILNETAAINYWQYPMPQTVVDSILSGEVSKTLAIRVRGVSSDGSVGAWTSERKFTISKDVAQFSTLTLGKTAAESNPPAYAPRSIWIKGDTYTLKGNVTHSSGIKAIKAKTENAPLGVQPLDTAGESGWYTDMTNGKVFAIPIKTSQYAEKSGEIEFTITAEDNRTGGQSIKSYSHIRLKYDNSIPAAAIGTKVGETARTAFNAGVFTASQPLDPAKKDRYRVVVNNAEYEIASLTPADAAGTGKTVTLNNAAGLTGTFDYGITEYPHIVQGSGYQVEGLASDTGSGISKITAALTVSSQVQTITLLTSDSPKTITAERGDLVSFKGSLNTTLLPNGKGTLKITVYDGAGNEVSDEVTEVLVKNSPLSITKLTFRTNLDGNSSYDENTDEVRTTELAADSLNGLNAERDYRGSVDIAQRFTYKDNAKSELVVELDGGYKTARTFELYKDAIAPANKIAVPNPAVNGNKYTFNLANLLDDIGDGAARKLILKVFDESIGQLWYAQADITVKVEHTDSTPPVGVIVPFFYNTDKQKLETEEDFKLTSVKYDAAKKEPLGHIELGAITGLDSANPSNTYPSVSGTVILRGTAYDNVRIKELKLSGANIANASITNTASGWQSGTKFTVKDKHNRKGHYVEWEYEWETGTPTLAQTITLTVTDTKNLNNTGIAHAEPATQTSPSDRIGEHGVVLASGDTVEPYQFIRLTDGHERSYLVQVHSIESGNKATWFNVSVPKDIKKYVLYGPTANNAKFTVNIVPYITKVETGLSSYSHISSVYNRTALGKYPVSSTEHIKIEGFNLDNAEFTLNGIKLNPRDGKYVIGSASSGELIAKVGTVESINNKNDNTKVYNQEPNRINNDLLHDDRVIDVWEFKQAAKPANGFIRYPVLKVSPKDGSIGLAYANGVSYFNMAGFGNAAGQTNYKSARRFDGNWAEYVHTDFVFDEHGYPYGMATGVDMNAEGKVASYSKFVSRRPGGIANLNNYGNRNGTQNGIGLRLENIGTTDIPYTADPNRIQSPSITTVTGTGDEETHIYLAYYDTINQHIRYRWGSVSKHNSNPFHKYSGQLIDLKGYGKMQEPPETSFSILAGPPAKKYSGNRQGSTQLDDNNNAGNYVSLAAVNAATAKKADTSAAHDVVTAVWYNFKERSLMYAYTGGTNTPRMDDVTWSTPVKISSGGQYVRSIADPDGGIHVAFYDNGNLKYAYLPNYKAANWTVAIVDSYSLTGTHISIDIARAKQGGKWIPYISYYMQGGASAKLAYLVDEAAPATGGGSVKAGAGTDEKFTGAWEVSIIPAEHVIQEYRINVGVYRELSGDSIGVIKAIPTKTASGSNDEWLIGGNGTANPVIGYAVAEEGAFETAQKK